MSEQNNQIATAGHNGAPYNRDATLLLWQEQKTQLDYFKQEEMKTRKVVVENEFANAGKGTSRVPLGNGYQLKAVKTETLSVIKNEADKENPYSHLPALMKDLPAHVASSILTWKPEVNTKVYNALTDAEREMVNKFVLLKDGSPALEIEAPKKAG